MRDTEQSQDQSSQEGDSQEGDTLGESQEAEEDQRIAELAKRKRKKDKEAKKNKKGIKSMTKEERQRRADELKAQRKEKSLERKKAKEEADKEKARLKREEHKMLLEKAQALPKRNPPAATAVRAEEETATTVDVHPEPSGVKQSENLLETSIVEPGPQLVSLNPFEGEDEPIIRPTSGAQPEIHTHRDCLYRRCARNVTRTNW